MEASKQFSKIMQGKLWKFFGGIKPKELKRTQDTPIEELPIPALITIPLDRHLGPDGEILVNVGDYVKTGQVLTRPGGTRYVPAHASTSGTVTSIAMSVLPHPSGFSGLCLTIKPDNKDVCVDFNGISNFKEVSPHELINIIRDRGIEGLGGAQFQTATKLQAAIDEGNVCNIFIVNGAECEPVATCDDRLMQEKADEIIQGVDIVAHILQPKLVLIAIEDNKPNAIKAMSLALQKREDLKDLVQIRVIPTLYPSGAARNLIKILTGIEIPYSEHTSECGIVVDNVETVFAIKEAIIDGKPLIKRVVTVDGSSLHKKGNALIRLGTSVRFVLTNYNLIPQRKQRIILGGPLMGFTIPSIDVPITKSTTCVLAPSTNDMEFAPPEMNCIRCGKCARVCPSRLVPYQLYAYSKAQKHNEAKKCGIDDCTECGCCSFVCPSKIRLAAQFRKEKAIASLIAENQYRNLRAKERMAIRNERLEKEAKEREAKKKAALARIAMQKNGTDDAQLKAKMIEEARARAKAKREAALLKQTETQATNIDPVEIKGNMLMSNAGLRQEAKMSIKLDIALEADTALQENSNIKAALPFNLRQGAVKKHYQGYNATNREIVKHTQNVDIIEYKGVHTAIESMDKNVAITTQNNILNTAKKLPLNLRKDKNQCKLQ